MTNQTPLHIESLSVHAFKRVEQITLEPDMFQLVGGNNANGKTSLLDAIWVALGGGAATRDLSRPIKDGHDSATIVLDLGDLKVERKFTAAGTTLTVTDGDGKKVGSPQTVLDRLIGRLGFDPGAFLNMSDKDQRAAILTLVDLPFDLDELEAERRQVFESRTVIGRDVARTKGAFEIADNPGDGPMDETSSADLVEQLTAAHNANAEADAWHKETDDIRARHCTGWRPPLSACRARHWRQMQNRLGELQTEHAVRRCRWRRNGSWRATRLAPRQNASTSRRSRRRLRILRPRTVTHGCAANAPGSARHGPTRKLTSPRRPRSWKRSTVAKPVRSRRRQCLSTSLTIGDSGLLYRGVPFAQASAAERIRVAFAVGCAANPNIRVACIRDGSLLDDDSLSRCRRACR
jgi:hypothetical protein